MRVVLFLLLFVIPGFSQSAQTSQDSPEPAGNPPPRRRTHETPCWRQAGLTAAMVNQRWKIEDDAKTKIATACNETSTTPQQKHTKIEQINSEKDKAIANLIPGQKLQAFNACQAEQDKKRPKPAGQKELGPCGGVIPHPDDAMGTEPTEHNEMKSPMR